MAQVKHLDAGNFEAAIKAGVALVDFWAEWCGPCKMIGPILEEVANDLGDEATVAKVNIEDAQELAVKYNVRSIPAIFVFKDGEVVNQFVGVQDKQTLIKAVKDQL